MNFRDRDEAPAGVTRTASAQGPMLKRFLSFLDRVEYRRIECGDDLEDIYRLRYKSYLRNGLTTEKASGLLYDDLDEAPNCFKFGVYLDGDLVSTLRVHHVTKEHPYSPAMDVYSDLLLPRLEKGERFIDPSRLAVDTEIATGSMILPTITMRIGYIGCTYLKAPYYMTMVRADHEVFYNRIFSFKRIAEARDYKGAVNCEVPLYECDNAIAGPKTVARLPFFRFTEAEGRMLFERPGIGENAPISILPSAKYLVGEAA